MSFVQRSLGSLVLLVVLCAAGIVFSVVYHYHCSSPNMTILDEEEEDLTVLDHQRLRSRDNSHQTNKEGVEKEDVPVWATKYDFVNESAQKHAQEIAKMPDVCFMRKLLLLLLLLLCRAMWMSVKNKDVPRSTHRFSCVVASIHTLSCVSVLVAMLVCCCAGCLFMCQQTWAKRRAPRYAVRLASSQAMTTVATRPSPLAISLK